MRDLAIGLSVPLLVLAAVIVGVWRFKSESALQKQKDTLLSLRQLKTELLNHELKFGEYPCLTPGSAIRLRAGIGGTEITASVVDGWGNPIQIVSARSKFALWSFGADGESDEMTPGGRRPEFSADLILSQDGFWQFPASLCGLNQLAGTPNPIESTLGKRTQDCVAGTSP